MSTTNSRSSASSESANFADVEICKDEQNVLDCDLTKIEYTSSEQLHSMAAFDSMVEVIGYVDSIEASKLVGPRSLKLFKFYLNNGSGDRVQVAAWRSEVDRCEAIVKPNLILHIDGAYAKPMAGNFNKGTINFELVIQSATTLNIFGYHPVRETSVSTVPEITQLKDIGGATQTSIRVRGFIKTNFGVIVKQSTSAGNDFGCGSITDGNLKIEIRIPKMDNVVHDFQKGDHVEVEGQLQMNANPIYILCRSISDIEKIDDKQMKLAELLQGYHTIVKEKRNETHEAPQKKMKKC